jgi:uncharacterized protein
MRQATERLTGPDELRGFALLGIAIVNLPLIARSWESFYQPPKDVWAQLGIFLNSVFFDGKIFPIFSFLFGIGLFLIGERSATRVLLRRSAGLLLLGVAHAILLFPGDILASYALLTLVFLGLRGRTTRTLLITAAFCMALTAVGYFVMGRMSEAIPDIPKTNYLGTYAEAIHSNLRVYPLSLGFVALFNVSTALAMFCLGYVTMRENLLTRIRAGKSTLFLLLVGLGASAFYATATALHLKHLMAWAMVALALTAPLLSAAYVQCILSTAQTRRGTKLLGIFRYAGQMSLTNYLLQSLLAGFLFHGYGLGLYNRISPLGLLGVSVLIFIFEALLSKLWLRYFATGPAEWVLRAFARWQLPPFRL